MAYYHKHVDDVLKEFSTSINGLSTKEAQSRLEKYGLNEVKSKKRFNALRSFLSQFADLLLIILLIAALISLLLGKKSDAVVMITIVLLNAIIGFVQEYKSSHSIDALKKMITQNARVMRDGQSIDIPAKEVVIGDILILEEGCKVAADARIISENSLFADESILTGESVAQKKQSSTIGKIDIVTADQKNIVFTGTNITHGNAYAVVVAAGKDTEFGKLTKSTEEIHEEQSPLQKEITSIGKLTAKTTLVIGIIVITLGIFRGNDFFTIFLFAVSLAVAVVPEGLPTTLSVSLALGVQRMARQKAIVRKLSSVETLGATTVICSDKTGTLTKNQMTVTDIWMDKKAIKVTGAGYSPKGEFMINEKPMPPKEIEKLSMLFNAAALCNNSSVIPPEGKDDDWTISGDPTEAALVVAAEKSGIKHAELLKKYIRLSEIPFDSEKKRMITVSRFGEEEYAFLKGSPIEVLSLCENTLINGKIQKLSKSTKEEIHHNIKVMARNALRVLGFAYKRKKGSLKGKSLEKEYIFIGLMGLLDPPRLEVSDAVKLCKEAGIRINIVTGDFGETAKAIAIKTGIADDNTPVITGDELNKMDDTFLRNVLKNQCIFARVSPAHKLRIITQLQLMGEIVAVTGDGVNDAPALKKSDIGVAMGLSGTDVARESSDIVLSDDSFATIASAVEQGRRIYENIKKLIFYLFCGISAELFTVFIGLFFGFFIGLPLPILAIQILLIDLGVEVLPSIALSLEPGEKSLMKKKPRNPNYRMMNAGMISKGLFLGLIIGVFSLFLFYKSLIEGGWYPGIEISQNSLIYIKATTMTFVTIIMFQMANAFNAKTESDSIFTKNLFKSKYLFFGVAGSILMVLTFTYLPFFNQVLHTAPLTINDWMWVIGGASSIIVIEEIRKLALRIIEAGRSKMSS